MGCMGKGEEWRTGVGIQMNTKDLITRQQANFFPERLFDYVMVTSPLGKWEGRGNKGRETEYRIVTEGRRGVWEDKKRKGDKGKRVA